MHEPHDSAGFDLRAFPPALRTASYFLAAAMIGAIFLGVIVSTVVV